MTQDAISARIVPDQAGDNIGSAVLNHPIRFTNLLRLIVTVGADNIRVETPVGGSSALRQGYAPHVQRAFSQHPVGVISNPVLYHDFVEEGRRPGKRPPVSALIPWVGSKLGIPPGDEREEIANAISWKIARSGTNPQRMVEKGWRKTRRQIKPLLAKHGLAVVKDAHG